MALCRAARTGTSFASTTLLALALLTLVACRSTPPAPTPAIVTGTPAQPAEPFRNIYKHDKDSAPVVRRDVDYDSIPDAVPKEEPRGKYGNKSPYTVLGKTYQVLDDIRGFREEGGASWYGEKFQGFRTSSMEEYDMYAMTAAHKTLPIPSYVRVTNLDNQRSVVVRVNDRGPFHEGRIIDLSWAAAQKLGYANVGTARVAIAAIDPSASVAAKPAAANTGGSAPGFYVQLGAFAAADAARRLGERAQGAVSGHIAVITGDDALSRVRLGPYEDRPSAEKVRDTLRAAGIGSPVLVIVP